MKEKTIYVSDTLQVGIPFSKSYYMRTPKLFRNIGDGISLIGTILTVTGVATMQPWLAVVASCAGLIGKYLTNCFSER